MQPVEDQLIKISQGIAKELLDCLQSKSRKVEKKYEYYNGDNDVRDFGISTPIQLANLRPGIGWASRRLTPYLIG